VFQIHNLHKNNIVHGDIKTENIGIRIIKKKNYTKLQDLKFNNESSSSSSVSSTTESYTSGENNETTNESLSKNDGFSKSNIPKLEKYSFVPSLLDFGVSIRMNNHTTETDKMNFMKKGTFVYCPMEHFNSVEKNTFDMLRSKDIHGLAIVLYVLFVGNFPFARAKYDDVSNELKGERFYADFKEDILLSNAKSHFLPEEDMAYVVNFVSRNHRIRCSSFDKYINRYNHDK
jgi:serine/threonine protein kinase